ncbi:unnamed protein product [Phytomonas sp. Hart1]|nr:unnamed protein product [Phytomonas sp. Hart1]|eukprot:CCW71296.1 unnamed protein product [Phytomonas sp. isolate Hart1]
MARGNQRDLAREKGNKKRQEDNKGKRNDGVSAAKRKDVDAERMRHKQAISEEKKNVGNGA